MALPLVPVQMVLVRPAALQTVVFAHAANSATAGLGSVACRSDNGFGAQERDMPASSAMMRSMKAVLTILFGSRSKLMATCAAEIVSFDTKTVVYNGYEEALVREAK